MSKRWSDKSGFQFERAHRGETNDWLTPPELVRALGKFDLDPCSAPKMPWRLARRSYTPPQDGLTLPWRGRVFCNPPYGSHTGSWLTRCASHGNAIALVFARVETRAFFIVWKTADALLFLPNRLSFYHLDGVQSKGRPAASVLIAWGKNNVKALRHSGLEGAFIISKIFITGRRIK